jgi:hypothetical protein
MQGEPVIWQDALHPALFALIVAAASMHAIMDCITFKRIHLALHPLADGWHLAQYIRIACYVGVGYIWRDCWWWDTLATVGVTVAGIVSGRVIWGLVMRYPDYWLMWDIWVNISTGWLWLDKILGFHN